MITNFIELHTLILMHSSLVPRLLPCRKSRANALLIEHLVGGVLCAKAYLHISNMHLRHPSVAGEVLDEVCVLASSV